MTIEAELTQAFRRAAAGVVEADDLLERVQSAIERSDEYRRRLLSVVVGGVVSVGVGVALVLGLSDTREGNLQMKWWILELIVDVLLVAIAVGLGPLIKRFGRSYAGDVFRANPRTGKSFLALTDVAYYLIFLAYIMFTMRFEPAANWGDNVVAEQMKHEVARTGGILLIIGLLHTGNIVALPMIGRLLTMNLQLDASVDHSRSAASPSGGSGGGAVGTAGGGQTFILRIEPAPLEPGPEPHAE